MFYSNTEQKVVQSSFSWASGEPSAGPIHPSLTFFWPGLEIRASAQQVADIACLNMFYPQKILFTKIKGPLHGFSVLLNMITVKAC